MACIRAQLLLKLFTPPPGNGESSFRRDCGSVVSQKNIHKAFAGNTRLTVRQIHTQAKKICLPHLEFLIHPRPIIGKRRRPLGRKPLKSFLLLRTSRVFHGFLLIQNFAKNIIPLHICFLTPAVRQNVYCALWDSCVFQSLQYKMHRRFVCFCQNITSSKLHQTHSLTNEHLLACHPLS